MSDERYLFEFTSPKSGVAWGDFVCFTLPLLFVFWMFGVSVHPLDRADSKVVYLAIFAFMAFLATRSLAAVLRSEHYVFSSRGITITRRFAFVRRVGFIPRSEVLCCVSERKGATMFGKSGCIFVIRRTNGTAVVVRSSCGARDVGKMVRYANSALGVSP